MDAQFEKAVINRIRELKLEWERVPNKAIYRAETQQFVLYLDSQDQSIDLYLKRKSTSEICKIYRSQYSDKQDWDTLKDIVEAAQKKHKDDEAYLLKEFVADTPKKQAATSSTVYVEDDLMDNTRTE